MGWIDVRVEQANRHTLDRASLQHCELFSRLHLVQRGHHAAVGKDPLLDAPAQIAGNERARRVAERAAPARVGLAVERTPHAAAVEHVAKPLRRQEGDLRQTAGDDGVDAHRARVVEDGAALDSELPRPFDDRGRGRSRSLGTLVTSIRPSLIETTSVNVPPMSTPSTSASPGPHRQLCSPSGVNEPYRGAGSREIDARHVWHLRTSHQPPSLSTRYSASVSAPHSPQVPATAAARRRGGSVGRGNECMTRETKRLPTLQDARHTINGDRATVEAGWVCPLLRRPAAPRRSGRRPRR